MAKRQSIPNLLSNLDEIIYRHRPHLKAVLPPLPLETEESIARAEKRADIRFAKGWLEYWLTPSVATRVAASSSAFLKADFELSLLSEATGRRAKEGSVLRGNRSRDLPKGLTLPIGRVGNGSHAWIRSEDLTLYEVDHASSDLTHRYTLSKVLVDTVDEILDGERNFPGWKLGPMFSLLSGVGEPRKSDFADELVSLAEISWEGEMKRRLLEAALKWAPKNADAKKALKRLGRA